MHVDETQKWWRAAMSSTASTFAKNASRSTARGFGSSALQLIGRRMHVEAELLELRGARLVEVGERLVGRAAVVELDVEDAFTFAL